MLKFLGGNIYTQVKKSKNETKKKANAKERTRNCAFYSKKWLKLIVVAVQRDGSIRFRASFGLKNCESNLSWIVSDCTIALLMLVVLRNLHLLIFNLSLSSNVEVVMLLRMKDLCVCEERCSCVVSNFPIPPESSRLIKRKTVKESC